MFSFNNQKPTFAVENSKPNAKRRKITPNWATVSTCKIVPKEIRKHKFKKTERILENSSNTINTTRLHDRQTTNTVDISHKALKPQKHFKLLESANSMKQNRMYNFYTSQYSQMYKMIL